MTGVKISIKGDNLETAYEDEKCIKICRECLDEFLVKRVGLGHILPPKAKFLVEVQSVVGSHTIQGLSSW